MLRCLLPVILGLLYVPCTDAALSATFQSATDVPVTASSYTPTGDVDFTLNFAPEPGTNLTVVKNTGLPFINGTFTNLPNGATVNLSYNGTTYPFVAWYYGGEGNNDLVLLWPYTKLAGWGDNTDDQLMDVFFSSASSPVILDGSGVLAGKTIVQVVQGMDHCMALTTEGRVYAWGSGTYGQLGVNVNDSSRYNRPVAVNVSPGTSSLAGKTIVSISAGYWHSLALCSDGTVSAWGADGAGQLGVGGVSQSKVPKAVDMMSVGSALTGKLVTAIAAGGEHSVALCSDGTVAAWGKNLSGQLGDGTTQTRARPVAVNRVSGASALFDRSVVSLAAGEDHNLALCADGGVVAWGDNDYGELGEGTTTQRMVPVAVDGEQGLSALFGKGVVSVTAGKNHSMALCSDGTLAAWGRNISGQLGDGTQTDRPRPVAVSVEEGASALFGKTVTVVSAGSSHNLALCSDRTLVSWGDNSRRQLGDRNLPPFRSAPFEVNSLGNYNRLTGETVLWMAGDMGHSDSSLVTLVSRPCDISLWGLVMDGYVILDFVPITDGDTTPSVDDMTDFGGVLFRSSDKVTHTFHLQNDGLETLYLTGNPVVAFSGPHTSDFTLVRAPSSTTVPGRQANGFEISFRPRGLGLRTATVTIPNNDPDEAPYEFVIQGTGLAPAIHVSESGAQVGHTSTVAFGNVGRGGIVTKTFVINNLGNIDLTDLTITKTGSEANDFVVSQPVAPVPPGASTSFTVQVSASGSDMRSALLQIASNDPLVNNYHINLTAMGVTPKVPTVTKPTATGISFDAVTFKGSLKADNSEQTAFFDYGTTSNYGSTAQALPSPITGNTATLVSAVVSGLLPNTTYHFRLRSAGVLGSATSASGTFTTLNRPPVAAADTAVVLPAGKVIIPVLANDSDPGDVLNIASFKQPPAAVGSVAKVGDVLVFTAAAGFNGGTFSYVAGDAHRGKSAAATVMLTLGSCTIGPDVTVASDSLPYELAVTADAPWGVVENVPWLSFVPPSVGANSVTFIPAPNASKTSRTGLVKIGGQTHTVTQSGVTEVPVLTLPALIPQAAVSANYELLIPTQNGPVTYTATGLPRGLVLSNITGKITGYPKEVKTAAVTVKAKNVRGESNTLRFDLTVLDIPPSVKGVHSAILEDTDALTDKLGGFLMMTVANTGAVSGTLKLGAGSHPFTGALNTALDPLAPDPEHAVLKTSVKRAGKPSVELTLRMNDPDTDFMAGAVTLPGTEGVSVGVVGGHHVWNAKSNPATALKGYYTAALQPSSADAALPEGDGFLTFTVTEAGGVSWSGQLADGTVITAQSGMLWADGRLPLFTLFTGGKGSLNQALEISPGARIVSGTPHWHKKTQNARAYGQGFSTSLVAVGAEYVPPGADKTLLGLTAPASVVLDFENGGISGVGQFIDLDQVVTVSAKHAASIRHEINPAKIKFTKLDVVKGTFAGTLTLSDASPFPLDKLPVSRPVSFQGVLIPSLSLGTGYFLLPGITGPPANVTKSPMTSGRVRIVPLP